MIPKKTKKLYLLLLFPLFFASCISNSDETKPKPTPEKEVTLTEKSILGAWEIYFYKKKIVRDGLVNGSVYRYTDTDGFSTTFDENGAFYERNVFDMEVIRGKYALILHDDPKKTDSIRFEYKTLKTKKDTTTFAAVPNIFDNRFVYYDKYNGTAQGTKFFIEDIRYYRHLEKGPNYYPHDNPEFRKTIVDGSKLLGTWQLLKKTMSIDGVQMPETAEDLAEYGTRYMFSIEGGKQVFREFLPGEENIANRVGDYKIIDDVVNMRTNDIDPVTGQLFSFKFWIREWTTSGNSELIIEGDKYRDNKDVLKEIEKISYHRKVN